MDINWDGLKSPNIFGNFQAGQEAAQEAAQTAAKRKARNLFATDPEGAEKALIEAGDYQTAEALAKRRERQAATATRATVGQKAGAGDYQGARSAAMAAGEFDLASSVGQLDEQQRKAASESADVLARYALSLKDVPYEEAKARLQQHKQGLMQLGLKPEQVDAFDPTPANIDAIVSQATDLKTALDQGNKDRDFGLREDQLGETRQHNRASEGIARGNLGVAQGNLAMRHTEHDARAAQGGYATPRVLGADLPPGY